MITFHRYCCLDLYKFSQFRIPSNRIRFDSTITATKMKFAIILVALLGCANASLSDDINDFLALLPTAEIQAITADHLANDPDFEIVLDWLKGDFIAIGRAVGAHANWPEVVEYFESRGVDIYRVINAVAELLQVSTLAAVPYGSESNYFANRSFHGWVDQIRAVIPFQELLALYREKKESSEDFRGLIELIKSPNFQTLVEDVAKIDQVQAFLARGRQHGVDVDATIDRLYALLGWTRS